MSKRRLPANVRKALRQQSNAQIARLDQHIYYDHSDEPVESAESPVLARHTCEDAEFVARMIRSQLARGQLQRSESV